MYAVNHLVWFKLSPWEEHIQAARHIFRYVRKCLDRGITFISGKSASVLEAFIDPDFAGGPSSSRSTPVTLMMLPLPGTICWKSHLQKQVVLSTTEAEFLAATEVCRELLWVKPLLENLDLVN